MSEAPVEGASRQVFSPSTVYGMRNVRYQRMPWAGTICFRHMPLPSGRTAVSKVPFWSEK